MTEMINVVHIPKNSSLGPMFLNSQEHAGAAVSTSMQNSFLQLEDQLDEAAQNQQAILFETCLRKIWIVKSTDTLAATDLQDEGVVNYKSQEAYKFLLEVICGLHSPVIGETEVFGQFRDQVVKPLSSKHPLFKLVNQLVKDAKEIRRDHLTHLGSQTYGSFCRRMVLDLNAVDMIGFGSFAQSILPWVAKSHIAGRVFVRDAQRYVGQTLTPFAMEDFSEFAQKSLCSTSDVKAGALIICAPISASDIKLKGYDLVIDLRETASSDPISHPNVITLQNVFAEIQKGSEYALGQKTLALEAVKVCASRFNNSMMLRPFGWEDICA